MTVLSPARAAVERSSAAQYAKIFMAASRSSESHQWRALRECIGFQAAEPLRGIAD